MAWREVERGSAIDIKKHKGTPYTGAYQGKKDITTKIGPQIIYEFQSEEDGEHFEIYGFTNLNRSMENVKEGQLCRITYMGQEKVQTKFGMKDVHQVKVEVDAEEEEPVTEGELEPL